MTEFTIASDGIDIAYDGLDAEKPNGLAAAILVHGFGSSRVQNWKSTGWFGGLTEAGFGVVAMDCRGHGLSGKPHEERFYGHDRMAEDVIAVMDAAGLGAAFVLGYSMGGFIALRLLAAHPEPGASSWPWAAWAHIISQGRASMRRTCAGVLPMPC